MNPIKPEVIHKIHTAVSISEDFFLSMAALHQALSERDLRYVNIRCEISSKRIATKLNILRIRSGLTRCVSLR